MQTRRSRVVIIGAGPAGLTAAHELAEAGVTDITVLEASDALGGIARSVNYKGNRIDIGGHRFFSKSEWVMQWWLRMLPLAGAAGPAALGYQGKWRDVYAAGSASESQREVMLLRSRLSRIYFGGKFFDYPLKANLDTALKLGLGRCLRFAASYAWAQLFPRRPERTLEDFFINRFGYLLYRQFFKDYTEKVWGVSCDQMSAEWGAQRIKSLSVGKALRHALLRPFRRRATLGQAQQTSLIERFLYPKYGPGQMWEVTAERLRARGVRVELQATVVGIERTADRISAVRVRLPDREERHEADTFISTMAIRDLVLGLAPAAEPAMLEIAAGLQYRDFVIVGLLYRRMAASAAGTGPMNLVPDNWIYVQEPGVKVGRLQIFNNWSPYLVRDPHTVWIGMEYFCTEGDDLWRLADDELVRLGEREMEELGLAQPAERVDGMVFRMPKAYPGYFGTYARFAELRRYLDGFGNLFLVGRNGMHRYNNQDHSMLSARKAVDAILAGSTDKAAIWAVNIDDEYHEEASGTR